MIIVKTVNILSDLIKRKRGAAKKVGFVPTMGALHAGHIALVASGKKQDDITICSIFVNPKQFNNATDFEKYPITIEDDIDQLERAGCDILFLPSVNEIYPDGVETTVYDLGYLETILEGKYRPGHYQGVCEVVDRLLTIVQPALLYLGQKDFQQCLIIKKLIELRKSDITIQIEKTVREADGLAMSSRNARLNSTQRQKAVRIFETLSFIKAGMKPGDLQSLKSTGINFLTDHGFKVDYLEIADPSNLHPLTSWNGKTPAVILVAAYLDDVRLIDNVIINQ